MSDFEKTLMKYKELNPLVKKGSVVLFGSDFFSELPVEEFTNDFGCDAPIYNRSIRGLSFNNVERAINTCVLDLFPEKLFIGMGENDMELSIEEIKNRYEWLLYTLHIRCKCAIYILSLPANVPEADKINKVFMELAKNHNCTYINICQFTPKEQNALEVYKMIRPYAFSRPFIFSDAVNMYV